MIWAVTPPRDVAGEYLILEALFQAGLDVLWLRKPGLSEAQYRRYLLRIPPVYRTKVMLSDYPALVQEMGLMGLHLGEKMRESIPLATQLCLKEQGYLLSTSIHTAASAGNRWDYCLLGPVFDSISKPGYRGLPATDVNCICPPYVQQQIIGIGGVRADNIRQMQQRGFDGAALLGTLWQQPENAVEAYLQCRNAWELQPSGWCKTL